MDDSLSFITSIIIGLITGVITGVLSGIIATYLTANYLYKYNDKRAFVSLLSKMIDEMKSNVAKLNDFEKDLQEYVTEIQSGKISWLPKVAVPSSTRERKFHYGYCDVKAFDNFLIRGYSLRLPSGKFESLSMFYYYCEQFNSQSQEIEVLIHNELKNSFDNKPRFDMIIPLFESQIKSIYRSNLSEINKWFSAFNPTDCAELIDRFQR